MNIQTKFNLDDLVYAVSHERMTRKTVCPVCNGKPPVIYGFDVRCQRCHGDGYITNGTYVKYRIAEHGIIGRISTETYANSDIAYWRNPDMSIGFNCTIFSTGWTKYNR